jgi:hypothetical protein
MLVAYVICNMVLSGEKWGGLRFDSVLECAKYLTWTPHF